MKRYGTARYEHEAKLLPAPTMVGEWCITPGNVNFRVCEGLNMSVPPGHALHGHYSLAWEVMDKHWKPTGHYYRVTPFPPTPKHQHKP